MSNFIKFRNPVTLLINSCKIFKCPYRSNNKWYFSVQLNEECENSVRRKILDIVGDDFKIEEFIHERCIYVKIPFKYDKFTCEFESCTYSDLCNNDTVNISIQCSGITKIQETHIIFFKLLKIVKLD